jgi:hypothetical protein
MVTKTSVVLATHQSVKLLAGRTVQITYYCGRSEQPGIASTNRIEKGLWSKTNIHNKQKKIIKNIANQAKKEIVFINIYIKLFYQITQTHTLLSLSLLSRNVTF